MSFKFNTNLLRSVMLAEILSDACVQTIQQHFGCGCRMFQTAFHVHGIHIWGVWVPFLVVDGHMASHSHHYLHRHFQWFVRVGWNLTLCKCANHASTLWLRQWNLSNCIPCPCHTYMGCLCAFSGCWWAYGFTLTLLPPHLLPLIWESSRLESYLMQVYKPCHCTLIEAIDPFKLHPTSMACLYEVFQHLLRLWMGIWLNIPQTLPQICESWLKSYLMQVCKWCH